MPTAYQKIVRSGIWYYGDETPTPVHIVRQNYDPIYETWKADELDGVRWPEEFPKEPSLNAEGEAYFLVFGPVPSKRPWTADGVAYMTADEAAAAVTERYGSRCEWK